MNNRYTFKAKRKDNGEWVYGNLIQNPNTTGKCLIIERGVTSYSSTNEAIKEYLLESYIEIIPETVCQCTGLQDVDGKDIFENDIISSNANLGYGKKQKKVEIISQVIYLILNDKTMSGLDTNQCSMFTARQLNKEQDYTNMDWSVFFNCKIIGNKIDKEEDQMSEEELYKLLNIPNKPWIELTDEEIQLFEKNNNYIKQLQKENTQLKQQLKETNNCLNLQISNVTLLEKELKDKDEKISKAIEYATHTEFEERTAYDTSFCEGVYNVKEKVLKILESNKED